MKTSISGPVAIVLIVVAVLVVGAAGWWFLSHEKGPVAPQGSNVGKVSQDGKSSGPMSANVD